MEIRNLRGSPRGPDERRARTDSYKEKRGAIVKTKGKIYILY